MSGTVLFLGARGKVARHAVPVFRDAGWTIRLYDRARGDMVAQAQGADVIVNGLNPPNYHNWARIVPQITSKVIEAARATKATVILPGNVYVYGDQPGPWHEETPHRPIARKGIIRAEMEARYAASGVQTINLRAGDFISVQAGDTDVMSEMVLRALHKGKVTLPGDPDVLRAYGYLPDWAQAACLLAQKRAELGGYTDLNLGGANFTLRQMTQALSARLGQDLRFSRFPWPLLRISAPVWELARELLEMRYLWQVPHELAQDRLTALLPEYRPTDPGQIMVAGAAHLQRLPQA